MRRAALAALLLACAPSGPRDVTDPEKHDTTQIKPPPSEGYEYVVRSPRGVLALAESRGIPKESARAVMDKLAASFDGCLRKLPSLAPGAARVIIGLDPGGVPLEPLLRPSDEAARATALLCLVAPARMLAFPAPEPTEAGAPGLAIEATWPPP